MFQILIWAVASQQRQERLSRVASREFATQNGVLASPSRHEEQLDKSPICRWEKLKQPSARCAEGLLSYYFIFQDPKEMAQSLPYGLKETQSGSEQSKLP